MPVHDWPKVDAGIFHAFHVHWISALDGQLNNGFLPPEYYALAEQITGLGNPDVLALRLSTPTAPNVPSTNGTGTETPATPSGVAIATAPPGARFTDQTDESSIVRKTRSVVIRHVSGHRIVAVIELISPSNKGSKAEIEALVRKSVEFIANGVHLLVLDLFPPTSRDPQGLHPLIWSEFKSTDFRLPPDKPLTLAAYAAGAIKHAYVDPVAVGDTLPDMPLFLTPEIHVPTPLDSTYAEAWKKMPRHWREVLEDRGG